MQIAVENINNDLSTPEKLVELLHAARFTDVGVCFDVGHAHMGPGIPEAFETLKPLIRTTHVHDNNGQRDAHLWPGGVTIDSKQTGGLLRAAQRVPQLLLEIEGVEGRSLRRRCRRRTGSWNCRRSRWPRSLRRR